MWKITFLLLPTILLYNILGGTKGQFEVRKNDTHTMYSCCDAVTHSFEIYLTPNDTDIFLEEKVDACQNVSIPRCEYCNIVVTCFRQIEPSFVGNSTDKIHKCDSTCISRISSSTALPVPTATQVSTSIIPISTSISTTIPSSSSTSLPTSISLSLSTLDGVNISIISTSVIVGIIVVVAALIATAVCCSCKRKIGQENTDAGLEAGGAPTYQTINELFFTAEQTEEEEERKALKDELVVFPFKQSERIERKASWSRGVRENQLDNLEKPLSDVAILYGVAEYGENVNGTIETYSAPSLSSALQEEEPVSASVDDHQTSISMHEIQQANTRSTTVSLQPQYPYFSKQSSYCPSVDTTARHATDSFTDRGQVTDYQENRLRTASCTM